MNPHHILWRADWIIREYANIQTAQWAWRDIPTKPPHHNQTRPGRQHTNGIIDPQHTPPSPHFPSPQHNYISIPMLPDIHYPGEGILITPTHYAKTQAALTPAQKETIRHYNNNGSPVIWTLYRNRGIQRTRASRDDHAAVALVLERLHRQ